MTTFTATALFNETSRFSAYKDGDTLKPSALGTMTIEADTAEDVAEAVFILLNRDDRPNGRFERSLSEGDVVEVERTRLLGLRTTRSRYACEAIGWRKIEA